MTEILPAGSATQTDIDALRTELIQYKRVQQTFRRQKANGLWGGNILGFARSAAQGIKEPGTVFQYRHLLELGYPPTDRALRLTDRVFHRLLSRDDDPALRFEYQKACKTNPPMVEWSRQLMREGATAALAHAGQIDDPRVRGAAHRIASAVSQFLRSELAEHPIIRRASRSVLHPDAYPPTIFSVAMVAYMPNLQRERAGFLERLGAYLGTPASKRAYTVQVGRRYAKPDFYILGDPLTADSAGNTNDIPFALHWLELLARMGMLSVSPVGQRILARLIKECDEVGVWDPKNLRTIPSGSSKIVDFAFPLELEGGGPESRRADVTFRLALIAKLAGWHLEFH